MIGMLRGRTLREWLLRLLLVALSSAVGLGAGELVLRLAPAGSTDYRSTMLPTRRTAPGQRADFRGRPYELDKGPGTFRILVVGDSFTWGPGVYVEDTYPDRLQRRLNELSSDLRLEVIAWSRSGWNTEMALQQVRDHLSRLKPDLLILGFVLNDAEPSQRELRRAMGRKLLRRRPHGKIGMFLHRHSRLYHMLYERLENTRQRHAFTAYYHELYADGPGWQACVSTLREFRALAREHSFTMLLVIFPVFDSQLGDTYAYRDLHGIVRRMANALEISVLDLLPAYQGIDARRLALEPFTNPHPNELAYRIAADRIRRYLLEQEMIPAERKDHHIW